MHSEGPVAMFPTHLTDHALFACLGDQEEQRAEVEY